MITASKETKRRTRVPKLTLSGLLRRGYLPIELPPPFTTEPFSLAICQPSAANLPDLRTSTRVRCEYVAYSLARSGSLRRRLAILNPLAYYRLASAIVKNQDELMRKACCSDLSLIKPIATHTGVLRRWPHLDAVPPKRAEVRVGKTILLSADVSRFYPSIYTHAIEWALSSKAAAKARISGKRPPRTIGAEIDALVQACQNGQTRGIPIGPASSVLLGEIILAQVDLNLTAQGIRTGFRAVDDYELLFDDRSGAERALTALEDALAEFELELNPQKTEIVALPQELENPGIQELRGFRIRGHNRSSERSDLLQFFTRAFARQREFPDKSILRYAVAALVNRAVHSANAVLAQSLVLQAVMAEPGVWPFAVRLVSELHKLHVTLPLNPIGQTIFGIISKCAPVKHSSEVAWSLWAALIFEIVLPENAANAVLKMMDDCCAIMLFHMAKRNLCETEPDATPFADLMDAESLRGPHWLISYELAVRDWVKPHSGADHISLDSFFTFLRENNVRFYDSTAVEALTGRPDEEEEIPY